jgi:hypothetical protein
MTSSPPHTQHDVVLAGVKAKPCGWPPASLDTGCGRRPIHIQREQPEDQDPPISGLYGFRGLPLPLRLVGGVFCQE